MKNLFSILALACLLQSTAIAAQVIEWQNTIGGNNTDFLYSIQQTSDGGYILGGKSYSNISGDKAENGNGNFDYWIVKTDSSGIMQWQNTIGGSNSDDLNIIQQTSDGGYICGGSSSSDISGDKTDSSKGMEDYWIVKTDSAGNIQWQKTIGGNDWDFLLSVQQTSDGGYILGGHSSSNISGDKTENSNGDADYWIVKTDASGNIQWQNTIGGSITDVLNSIQQTSDGGYILGGYSSSNISGDKSENNLGSVFTYDYWLVKTDSLGNIQWQKTIGGSSIDELNSMQQTSDGGYILGGLSSSNISGDKTENSNGSYDYWIVKTDSSGNIQWQNTIGGSSTDELNSVRQTSDGGYILAGYSGSNISGDKTKNNIDTLQISYDYWIVKTNTSGNIQWQKTIGGRGDDKPTSIQPTIDGGYILGGFSGSNISADKTENSNGGYDYWIVKLTENYNSITGKLFFDANSNGVQDTIEPAISNKMVIETATSQVTFSQPNGFYSVTVLDSGNFTITPSVLNYYTTLPSNHVAHFPGIHLIDSLNDFAYQPAGAFNDLLVQIAPLSTFRPGFNAMYQITYENVGTTILNPIVIFFPDTAVSFVSAVPSASTVAPDSVVWNFGPLTPFQKGSIRVTVNVDSTTSIGTMINSPCRIEPLANDTILSNNYSTWPIMARGSYDPNEILVDRDTLYTTELSNPPSLEYIINFQNTGNDTAFTVKVLNPVDTAKLNLSSFEYVASSHPVNIKYVEWENNLEFRFDNILLADSGINEPGSHGFVRYRIKPKSTLAVGDSIRNTAYIYFDFNQPIQTNTAVTEIVLPTGLAGLQVPVNGLQVFPNPASQSVTVQLTTTLSKHSTLVIFDLFGRKVWQTTLEKKQSKVSVDVSGFSDGVYFIELQSNEATARAKFLKQ